LVAGRSPGTAVDAGACAVVVPPGGADTALGPIEPQQSSGTQTILALVRAAPNTATTGPL